jgi:hypothetical protein
MIDVNRTLHDAGGQDRATVLASVDIDADLLATLQRAVTPTAGPERSDAGGSRGARFVIGAAAALVLMLVGVLVVISRDTHEVDPTGTIDTRPDVTLAPATTVEIATPPPESSLPEDGAASSTTVGSSVAAFVLPPQPVVVPVSYLDPPETFQPDPFASIDIDTSITDGAGFAVGDGIIVVTGREPVVTVFDVETGSSTSRTLAVAVSNPVLGPGNVLYGLSFTPSADPQQAMPDAALVAQALDADPVTVIDSVPLSTLAYTEIPAGTFVAGTDGIYDVERAPGKVMDYVNDVDSMASMPAVGRPSEPRPNVRAIDGSAEWVIELAADPNAASPFLGPTPPAPGPNGTTRLARFIGPRLETDAVDFGTPTKPVIADLAPGAGKWWSLPDDWRVVASSTYGTLLARGDGTRIDLGWFDPPAPPALPLAPTTVLALDNDQIVSIDRDDVGAETRQPADGKVGWPNGCTLDAIEALFAEAPAGSALERLACDRSASTIAVGDFSTNGVQSSITLLDDPAAGWTPDFDDATANRFSNLRPTPIVTDGAVPTGDTFPTTTSITDTPDPNSPALHEIAAGVTTPAEFGDEIVRLFQQAAPNTEPTSTVHNLNATDLVIVTQPSEVAGVNETIHYYWLSQRDGVAQLFLDRAVQTLNCTNRAEGTECA